MSYKEKIEKENKGVENEEKVVKEKPPVKKKLNLKDILMYCRGFALIFLLIGLMAYALLLAFNIIEDKPTIVEKTIIEKLNNIEKSVSSNKDKLLVAGTGDDLLSEYSSESEYYVKDLKDKYLTVQRKYVINNQITVNKESSEGAYTRIGNVSPGVEVSKVKVESTDESNKVEENFNNLEGCGIYKYSLNTNVYDSGKAVYNSSAVYTVNNYDLKTQKKSYGDLIESLEVNSIDMNKSKLKISDDLRTKKEYLGKRDFKVEGAKKEEQDKINIASNIYEYVYRYTNIYSKDYNSKEDLAKLFVDLAKNEGIPARVVYGLEFDNKSKDTNNLGSKQVWAEFFVNGYGFIPVTEYRFGVLSVDYVPLAYNSLDNQKGISNNYSINKVVSTVLEKE